MSISNLCSSSLPRVIQNVAGIKLKDPLTVTAPNDGKEFLAVFGSGTIPLKGKWDSSAVEVNISARYQVVGSEVTICIPFFISLENPPLTSSKFHITGLPDWCIPSDTPTEYTFSSLATNNSIYHSLFAKVDGVEGSRRLTLGNIMSEIWTSTSYPVHFMPFILTFSLI